LRQFRGDAPFWGWMKRVVVNQAISMLRKNNRHEAVELEDYHESSHSDVGRMNLSMDLQAALAQLDEHDRAVVWLHDVEGYSHKEIAAFYEKTESFSKTRLSRAHARLRELIQAQDDAAVAPEPDSAAAENAELEQVDSQYPPSSGTSPALSSPAGSMA